jgi:hypothetical protein
VALVGAGGHSGTYMARALLATGKHVVTALTRAGSTSTLPEGVVVKNISYDDADEGSLVEALRGQDALIITLGTRAPAETQPKLIRAAAAAGVPWVLPNEWGPDDSDPGLARDVPMFSKLAEAHKLIADTDVSSYVVVTCGYWYEWSLSIPISYGFDIRNKEVTFFDDGRTKINTTTWPQLGRAVAAIMSLPIKAEPGSDPAACLDAWRNKHIYVSSFLASQEDMLESILRVTGDKRDDWTIRHESSTERYAASIEASKNGDPTGYVKTMYSRVFYQDGSGDYESRHGTANAVLGLPSEDIDEATRAAIKMSENPLF